MARATPVTVDTDPGFAIRGPVVAALLAVMAFAGAGLSAALLVPVERGVRLTAVTVAPDEPQVIVAQRNATVARLHVSDGQKVAAGDLLVTFDTKAMDEELAVLRAELETVEKQIADLRLEVSTAAQLAERKSAPVSGVAALQDKAQRASLEAARLAGRIRSAETEIGKSAVRAPAAGVVANLAVAGAGMTIESGNRLMDIADPSQMLVVTGLVSGADSGLLAAGLPATAGIDGSRHKRTLLSGQVLSVSKDSPVPASAQNAARRVRIGLAGVPEELTARLLAEPGIVNGVRIVTGRATLIERASGAKLMTLASAMEFLGEK